MENTSPVATVLRRAVLVPALAAASGLLVRSGPAPAPAWTSSSRLWGPATCDLSVVLPSYNPGPAITRTVVALLGHLDAAGIDAEVVVVSDGSTDGSEEGIEELDPRVTLLRSPANAGKGAALHRGFAACGGRHVAFLDADGDICPGHVVRYWQRAVDGGHDGVFADKRHARSEVAASPVRRALSRGFTLLTQGFFELPVTDTQTGCKVFRRDVLAAVLPVLHERGFAIDLEIFVAATAVGFTDFASAPVRIGERLAGSTVGVGAVLRTLREALSVLGRLRIGHAYGSAPVVPLAVVLDFAPPRPSLAPVPPQRVPADSRASLTRVA